MIARCTKCENFLFWDEKEIKKQILFKPSCHCGGVVELMTSSGCLKGHHPHYSAKTFFTETNAEPYFFAYKNAKGEFFVYYNDKMVAVKDPIPFTKPPKV